MSDSDRPVFFWILLLGAVVFALAFRVNLHCSEDTSLSIVMFDSVPDEESEYTPTTLPYAFRPHVGSPLRFLLGVSLLAFLIGPQLTGLLAVASRLTRQAWALLTTAAVLPLTVGAWLPEFLVGQRFRAMAQISLAIWLIPIIWGAVRVLRHFQEQPTVTIRTATSIVRSEKNGAA
jgi:hypothetical protein